MPTPHAVHQHREGVHPLMPGADTRGRLGFRFGRPQAAIPVEALPRPAAGPAHRRGPERDRGLLLDVTVATPIGARLAEVDRLAGHERHRRLVGGRVFAAPLYPLPSGHALAPVHVGVGEVERRRHAAGVVVLAAAEQHCRRHGLHLPAETHERAIVPGVPHPDLRGFVGELADDVRVPTEALRGVDHELLGLRADAALVDVAAVGIPDAAERLDGAEEARPHVEPGLGVQRDELLERRPVTGHVWRRPE